MLPNLIIIGAQKCGTTSLHYYLSQHPEIAMSRTKELNFFTADGDSEKNIGWYENQFEFPKARRAKVRGESSPSYTRYPHFTDTSSIIHALVPEAKLIYLVRDPIHRMMSHYLHLFSTGVEVRDFRTAMNRAAQNPDDVELGEYIYRSRYFFQLSQYLPLFSRQQIVVVAREDLLDHRRETLQKIFKFLHVDPTFWSPNFERIKHRTKNRRRKTALGVKLEKSRFIRSLRPLPHDLYYRLEQHLFYPLSKPIPQPSIDHELQRRLTTLLQDDVDQLRKFTGCAFEQWSL